MTFMVEIGLFENSTGIITCLKLAESIDKSMTNSPKMRAWLESKSVMTCADGVMTPPDTVKTCAELEVEVEVEKKIINKQLSSDADTTNAKKPKVDLQAEAFQEFWKCWPTKVNKQGSLKAFKKAYKAQSDLDLEGFTAMIAADIQRRLQREQFGFDKLHCSTYLNGSRWEDQLPTNAMCQVNYQVSPQVDTFDREEAKARQMRETEELMGMMGND